MKLIRIVLGKIILTLDRIFSPEAIRRSPEDQAKVDESVKSLTLYHLLACPFCVKVRRKMKALALHFPVLDIGKNEAAYQEMMAGGKEDQVPCLKIVADDGSVQWMYESDEINAYLEKRFS